ncbi:MAG: hypothetical protein WDN49_08880 [Acetobacteraceae bacterium]
MQPSPVAQHCADGMASLKQGLRRRTANLAGDSGYRKHIALHRMIDAAAAASDAKMRVDAT